MYPATFCFIEQPLDRKRPVFKTETGVTIEVHVTFKWMPKIICPDNVSIVYQPAPTQLCGRRENADYSENLSGRATSSENLQAAYFLRLKCVAYSLCLLSPPFQKYPGLDIC